ncbi:MAG TPA: hypothetical protein VI457_00020 [Methylococcaceae bacterium]|nr:hypothetical protein [Methylococcaceae bacterium]
MWSDKRLVFVLLTIALALGTDLVAWALHGGWIAAALITFALNALIVYHTWKTRDGLFGRLYLFGLLVGFGELPTDYLAVSVQQTLVYAPGEPFIWDSPFYMPFSWALIMFQFGYLAYWMANRWGLWRASLLTGVFGAINLPTYEFIAKQAGYWYYKDCWMVFFDSTPVYVIVGEFLLTVTLPFIVGRVVQSHIPAIVAWAVGQSVWMYLATRLAYAWVGQR